MADGPQKLKAFQRRISFKEREYFSENLALLLKAGVPINDALASIEESTRSAQMKKSLHTMQLDIEAGASLANALEKGGIVSRQTLELVRLGEQSGHLTENLQVAAQQEEKRHVFHAKVRSALIYPVFVLGLTLIVGLGVAWFLLPRLAVTFSQLNVDVPFISQVMINVGTFLQKHGIIAVPGTIVFALLIGYVLFAAPKTRRIGQHLLFKVPGISRLMREVEIAQFGYLLGTLLDAGLPVTRSITLLAGSSNVEQYEKFYRYLASSLEDGLSFKQSLAGYKGSTKLLPQSVQQMIIAGEKSGSLIQVLRTVGRTYEQKADTTTQNLEAILEPILLVIVWIGVVGVAIAVIVPIYSLVGGLGG